MLMARTQGRGAPGARGLEMQFLWVQSCLEPALTPREQPVSSLSGSPLAPSTRRLCAFKCDAVGGPTSVTHPL